MAENQRKRAMREQGYTDGAAGRPARWLDIDYQRSWRHGRDALEARKTGGPVVTSSSAERGQRHHQPASAPAPIREETT